MRIVLLKPSYTDSIEITPPLGLGYLAAVVRQEGHQVKIYDNRFRSQNLDHLLKDWLRETPDILGISAVNYDLHEVGNVVTAAKGLAKDVKIVVGGPAAWSDPNAVFQHAGVDFILRGEGEQAFLQLLHKMSSGNAVRGIAGVVSRNEWEAEKSFTAADLVGNLDELPWPAWDLFDTKAYFRAFRQGMVYKYQRYFPVLSSRGCPYQCIYCHRIFGQRFRGRSPDGVLDEVYALVANYGIRELHFIDDIFNYDKVRAETILLMLSEMPQKLAIAFPNGLRGDRIDETFANHLAQAGTYRVSLAIESASPAIQKTIKKYINLEKIFDAIRLLDQNNIFVNVYNMLGFPGESRGNALQTIDFACRSRAHTASFFMVNPFPGTELYERFMPTEGQEALQQDRLHYFSEQVARLGLSSMSTKELTELSRRAEIKFYFGRPSRLFRIIWRIPRKRQLLFLPLVVLLRSQTTRAFRLLNGLRAK